VSRVVAALVVLLALVAAGCGGDDEPQAATETQTETSGAGCDPAQAPPPRADGGASQPDERLDPEKTWTLTFDTNCGRFVVTLDPVMAAATTASLVALAEDGFYDDTIIHRIVPGFVLQGGDPTQSGSGGPGYSTRDVPPADAAYTQGVMAMAKTAEEPPGTAGSQFFVVTGEDVGLPPEYAIVGSVTDGQDVVDLIDTLGDPATEQPLATIVVRSVTVDST
jgi:cyclophilin family peptidyl-prolyl cis-trans isomerase